MAAIYSARFRLKYPIASCLYKFVESSGRTRTDLETHLPISKHSSTGCLARLIAVNERHNVSGIDLHLGTTGRGKRSQDDKETEHVQEHTSYFTYASQTALFLFSSHPEALFMKRCYGCFVGYPNAQQPVATHVVTSFDNDDVGDEN